MSKTIGKRKLSMKSATRSDSSPFPAQASSDWAAKMHEHFQLTGYFRTDDLNRLLGDPRHSVSVAADDGARVNCLVSK
ncbi:MAG: hypothetical protein QM808_16230 [Steroidobacteraceae bacterium]